MKAPQKTPTTSNSLTSARLIGNFGIFPEAKPITKILPYLDKALEDSSKSSPPTGSKITSTPILFVKSFN